VNPTRDIASRPGERPAYAITTFCTSCSTSRQGDRTRAESELVKGAAPEVTRLRGLAAVRPGAGRCLVLRSDLFLACGLGISGADAAPRRSVEHPLRTRLMRWDPLGTGGSSTGCYRLVLRRSGAPPVRAPAGARAARISLRASDGSERSALLRAVLKARNGEVIGKNEMYSGLTGVRVRIASVAKNAPTAATEDLTQSALSGGHRSW